MRRGRVAWCVSPDSMTVRDGTSQVSTAIRLPSFASGLP